MCEGILVFDVQQGLSFQSSLFVVPAYYLREICRWGPEHCIADWLDTPSYRSCVEVSMLDQAWSFRLDSDSLLVTELSGLRSVVVAE